ncbi:U-box domain-containing protein 52-like [Punica granatum]|uniref:RING-type E3 ubiquitin transferase n=1 Tax=Punica granatum TaxID=22663 RepID=A0A6P8CPN0_PUNGR|nr:U-box domain-containing protein 52-like [Punica granatum]
MSFFIPFYPTISTAPNGSVDAGSCRNSTVHGASPAAKEGGDKFMAGRCGLEGSSPFDAQGYQACQDIDTASQASSDNGSCPISMSIAVAIDKDKNSPHAVRWAVDNLTVNHPYITLIHVNRKIPNGNAIEGNPVDRRNLFGIYRSYLTRKGVQLNEVVIDETDVSKALLEYIANNYITNMVVGASTRNALTRKMKHVDVSNVLSKSSPDFCSVYVISKGRVTSVKQARRSAVNTATPPRTPTSGASAHPAFGSREALRATRTRRRSTGSELLAAEKKSITIAGERDRNGLGHFSLDNLDIPIRMLRSPGRDSTSDFSESEFPSPQSFGSIDLSGDTLDLSMSESDSPTRSSISQSSRELEAEMKRLKLELKQTMDMYSNACKEAISAKKKAAELQQLKMEEARKFAEARLAEEAALALAEMEKAKCKAAIEAAEKAKKMADEEAEKRREAELKAKLEAEEKDKALSKLHQNDVWYRKYSLTEIEEATNNFSKENKIGEGGYGPVYKGKLDHTPVAIKVLRSGTTKGVRQFHQEVEVLFCMRHPNMVLLLGTCPEYGCLVYEYMDFGSLDDRLFRRGSNPPISWRRRFKIAAEIATALLFLHQAKPEPLVHRDLKPANILLDHNYKSKISDVGLARLVPPTVVDSATGYHMTNAAGTFCYIDPEYQHTGKLTTKSDIYSLGILLLQMITAKPPIGLTHQVQMAIAEGKLEELLDPEVREWPMEEMLAFAKLALECAQLRQKDRPDLKTVIVPELNRFRDFGRSSDSRRSSNHSTPRSHGPASDPVVREPSETGPNQTINQESQAQSSPC